jgi:hypothetical protein
MPRRTKSVPEYRRHRASNQAVVTLDGRDFYLRPYGSQASRLEYDRLIAEWLANDRRLPREPQAAPGPTVNELILAYLFSPAETEAERREKTVACGARS